MSASLTITGGDALRGQLLGLAAKAQPAIEAALYQEAQTISRESQERVPVDTGTLKNSAYTAAPTVSGNVVRVEMGYGGAAAEYAAIVHQDMEAHHPVGGPKYLESVINEHEAGFSERIGAAVAKDLGL